jgi:ATP-dependent DNA helicase PIF1
LPAHDPHSNNYSYNNNQYSKGGYNSNDRGNPNNDNDVSLFQNEDFLKSLINPPPITVKLPPDLRVSLNEEQCLVVESILSGHSTFFTGPAGSGKSHVLSTLLKANGAGIGGENNNGQPRNIVVTATTGVAACNVGGITIHSFGGVGAGNGTMADMAKRVMGNEYTKQRWREVDVLVIDEVSMMAGSFLDKLSFIASRARNDRRPFGGIQLVLCGDFFQLPPVELSKDGFAFEAKCWSEVIKCSVLLTQVFRQRGDQTLLNILDEARIGELSAKSVEVLRRHSVLPASAFANSSREQHGGAEEEQIKPTLLECRNRDVDKANELEMDKLPGEVHSFLARDRAINDTYKAQLKHCQAPAQLDLKLGAQVMLLKNIDLEKGLANGSRGVVVRFQRPHNESEIPTGFKKLEFPVVRFDSIRAVGNSVDGDGSSNGDDNEFVIHPEEWTNKMGDQTVSSRVQIPLRPAWSISVHKSQGMTIPNLTVNLAGVFEFGQAYVALSRATELKYLTLRGFSEKAFRAHPKVKEFYRLLNGGAPNPTRSEKENLNNFHDDFGDIVDPFVAPTPRNVARGSGSTPVNPYFNHPQQASSSYSGNPYNRQQRPPQPAQFQQRVSPIPQQQQQHQRTFPTPPSASSVSPVLTAEQKRRMEENRKRALAIRMKKQQS